MNKRLILYSGFFFLIFTYSVVYCQIKEQTQTQQYQFNQSQIPSSTSRISTDLPNLFNQLSAPQILQPGQPVEEVVNVDKYIVGPNDFFLLGIYGYLNTQLQLYVNPEGSITIPSVGEIQVAGKTLSQAKADVVKAVKKRYYNCDVSFTLANPRTFLVSMTGLVQGKFHATPLTRASELLRYVVFDTLNISRTYFEKQAKESRESNLLRTQMSMRNVTLKRKDGSELKVDLYKYYMTNNDEYNPYLLEGDLMIVPYTLLEKNYVSVYGAVQLGGIYEYCPGDDLETVIGLARGLDTYAEPDSVLLYRPYQYKPGFEFVNLSYSKDKHYPIKLFDRVFVKYKTDYYKMATVLILGEVQRPGYYPISYKNSRLRDVIDMAGGTRETAYLPLCILFRHWDAEYFNVQDSIDLIVNTRANDLLISPVDRINYNIDLKSRRNRVIVDFDKLLTKNDESQNVILEDKDIIYINDNKNAVYVFGQVNNEGFITFKSGADFEYYIKKAGGYTLGADEGNARIIKFHSRGWYEPDQIKIEPGDFLYVPKLDKKPFAEKIVTISQIAGVILAIVSTILLFRNTNN